MSLTAMVRVAAYCRVSTDGAEQAGSLASQKEYFSRCTVSNPDWQLVGIYADEGVTGTSTRKRAAFNRMLSDALEGKIDLILTKEISRFARNTLDSIFYTRALKQGGVGVLFLNDGINTLEPDAELRLTILSSIAQEESRRTSQRVKWGQKRRMEQGVVFGRDMLGYDVREGKLYLNEEGAKAVRLIFELFLKGGLGASAIARELDGRGVQPSPRMSGWSGRAVLRILRNEKYCGDLCQKKTVTLNYLTHTKTANRGEEELVVIRDHHTPIVSRKMFEEAARLLGDGKMEGRQGTEGRWLSGKLICGICGRRLVPRVNGNREGGYTVWRCAARAAHGIKGCRCRIVRDDEVTAAVEAAFHSQTIGRGRATYASSSGDGKACRRALERVVIAQGNRLEIVFHGQRSGAIYLMCGEGELSADWYGAARQRRELIRLSVFGREAPYTGTEELGHEEMVCAIIHQLTRNLSIDEIKASGFDTYFVDHTVGIFPAGANGMPYTDAYIQSTGDPIADISENIAAEQKARLSYDNILRLVDDPDVRSVIKFLREREIVHLQRFGESLGIVQDNLNSKNFYAFNPAFDKKKRGNRGRD